MLCPICQEDTPNNSRYCQYCGHRFFSKKEKRIIYWSIVSILVLSYLIGAKIYLADLNFINKELPQGMLTKNVSIAEIGEHLRYIEEKGITDPTMQLSTIYAAFGKEVGDKFNINGNRQITINIDGIDIPIETFEVVK